MKIIYFIFGCIFALLGMIGVILPILPTTPFLLMATFCFAKSSKRFHQWFINTGLYKKHLESFVKEKSMTLRTKISLLAFASIMLLIAMYLMRAPILRLFILCLMGFKYYYFTFKIKTIKETI